MNRRELRDDVRHRIAETSSLVVQDPDDPDYDANESGGYWKDSFINRKLDEAYMRWMRAARWSWAWRRQDNIPVAAGNPNIELIDDIEDSRTGLLVLTDTAGRQVMPEKVEPPEGVRLSVDQFQSAGEPLFYYVANTVLNTYEDADVARAQIITLVPTPSVAYTAVYHYIADPAGMATDAAEPDMPKSYHPALAAYAAGQCFKREMNSAKAREQFEEFASILNDALVENEKQGVSERITWGRPAWRHGRTDRDWYERHIPRTLG